jgi:hypothetical protein
VKTSFADSLRATQIGRLGLVPFQDRNDLLFDMPIDLRRRAFGLDRRQFKLLFGSLRNSSRS